MRPSRPPYRIVPLALVAALSACTTAPQERATARAAAEESAIIVRSDDPLAYRFDMQQGGRSMSADEFDAWMKARGIRIAKGRPAAAPGKRGARRD